MRVTGAPHLAPEQSQSLCSLLSGGSAFTVPRRRTLYVTCRSWGLEGLGTWLNLAQGPCLPQLKQSCQVWAYPLLLYCRHSVIRLRYAGAVGLEATRPLQRERMVSGRWGTPGRQPPRCCPGLGRSRYSVPVLGPEVVPGERKQTLGPSSPRNVLGVVQWQGVFGELGVDPSSPVVLQASRKAGTRGKAAATRRPSEALPTSFHVRTSPDPGVQGSECPTPISLASSGTASIHPFFPVDQGSWPLSLLLPPPRTPCLLPCLGCGLLPLETVAPPPSQAFSCIDQNPDVHHLQLTLERPTPRAG